MTTTADVFTDAFRRVREVVHDVVGGLSADQLLYRPGPDANSIGWLVWHLTRVQDDHVSEVAGTEQAWTGDGWSGRFGLPYDDATVGYGQTSAEVGKFPLSSAATNWAHLCNMRARR